MSIAVDDLIALEDLEKRIESFLPEYYQTIYENILPISMGSAPLKYGVDGRVAWNEIWATFCDLAMAGGPPHRGSLLEPARPETIAADLNNYRRVTEEICRGISLVTSLAVLPRTDGWIAVECPSIGMAGWLARAIVMENVLARHEDKTLFLPAGPEFRMEKEIKNVITSIAKTCHYWTGHMSAEQQTSIDAMLASSTGEKELLEPASPLKISGAPDIYRRQLDAAMQQIHDLTGWSCFPHRYSGWIGIETPGVRTAIWMMRAIAVEQILVRREDTVLFLPIDIRPDPSERTARAVQTLTRAQRLLAVAKIEN